MPFTDKLFYCEVKISMKQLDIVVSPPVSLWNPYLTVTNMTFHLVTMWHFTLVTFDHGFLFSESKMDGQMDWEKAMHLSSPCMSTVGFKNWKWIRPFKINSAFWVQNFFKQVQGSKAKKTHMMKKHTFLSKDVLFFTFQRNFSLGIENFL